MLTARIAVLVSGGGTNLQALLDAQAAGRIPHGEIALVVSNRADAYALERAKKAGVPAVALPGKDFEPRLTAALQSAGIEMMILAGFLKIRLMARNLSLAMKPFLTSKPIMPPTAISTPGKKLASLRRKDGDWPPTRIGKIWRWHWACPKAKLARKAGGENLSARFFAKVKMVWA